MLGRMVEVSSGPIRVEGRRLRPIHLSAVMTAVGLGFVVLAFLGILASALTGVPALGDFGYLCGAAALAIVGRYTWTRLTLRGRSIFGIPIVLVLCWLVLRTLALPGAAIAAYASWIAWMIAVGFGVVGRPAGVSM